MTIHNLEDHDVALLQTQLQLHHEEVGCTHGDRGDFLGNTFVLLVTIRHVPPLDDVLPTRPHTCI